MNKPSFLTESSGRRSLPVVLALILLPIITISQVAPSQENESADRQEASRRLVQIFLQLGQEQYDRGYYDEAVKTFLDAQEYEKDLTVAVREQLSEHLKESQIAVLKRKDALQTLWIVNELIKRDQLNEAKTHLEKIKDNEFLPEEERKRIPEVFRRIDAQIIADKAELEKAERKKPSTQEKSGESAAEIKKPAQDLMARRKEISDLWNESIGLYHTGQYEKAREGFIKVASSDLIPPAMRRAVEDYLSRIDKLLPQRAERKLVQEQEEPVVVAVVEPGVGEPELAEPKAASEVVAPEVAPRIASPVTGQSNYIEVINRRRSIIRSHTEAVVNDAIAKARSYNDQGRFDKARDVIETAALTVNENQMHLGDELFKEYSSKLKLLTEEIADAEN